MKAIDTLTVTFDSSLDDEAGICISRVVNGKVSILKMELGVQADILYHLLTEQMTKAAIKVDQERTGHWILDEADNSITCDKCGCLIWANDISNGEAYYCPNCGARMESEVDND